MSREPGSDQGMKELRTMRRREFITASGGAALSVSVLRAGQVAGTAANSKLKLGLVGCGMRGKWIADLFVKHGGFHLAAAADYFQDRVDEFGEKYGVPAARRFTKLSGYKRLLEQDLDAVAIETPPYFHPEQAAAAVDAGVHVMLAKPVAVDVPGTMLIRDLGPKATAKKVVLFVDFQTRANSFFREAVKRVHYGDIGRIGFGEACFNGGDVWNSWNPISQFLEGAADSPEARLKAWGLDKVLSGDIIVEQCIHSIDVATWILDADPVSAYGTGARHHYKHGDILDCFAVAYTFPGNVPILVNAKQFGEGYSDIGCRIHGLKGTIDTHYGGDVSIRGGKPYKGGNTGNLYPEGTAANIAEFHETVLKAQLGNPTVLPSVRSNLASILGRVASYRKTEVTWDDLLKAGEKLESDVVRHLSS
jgi:myo-inositol 2-dehydrogenase / D-chiro-inositol 1-dehydrogenase